MHYSTPHFKALKIRRALITIPLISLISLISLTSFSGRAVAGSNIDELRESITSMAEQLDREELNNLIEAFEHIAQLAEERQYGSGSLAQMVRGKSFNEILALGELCKSELEELRKWEARRISELIKRKDDWERNGALLEGLEIVSSQYVRELTGHHVSINVRNNNKDFSIYMAELYVELSAPGRIIPWEWAYLTYEVPHGGLEPGEEANWIIKLKNSWLQILEDKSPKSTVRAYEIKGLPREGAPITISEMWRMTEEHEQELRSLLDRVEH